MKPIFLFLLLFSILLVACGDDETPMTPTPFDVGQTAVAIIRSEQPTAVPLADLVAEPESFAGQFLQLSGAYHYLPLLVCNGETHAAPAGWLLSEEVQTVNALGDEKTETIQIAAGGFDSQLRSLLAVGTPLTVNGFWRYWEGPVGCGKQAVPRQLWYLRVTDIVSPAQLAGVSAVGGALPTLESTPGEEGGEGTAVPTPPITSTLPFTPTEPLPEVATPTLPVMTPTTSGELPALTLTPTPQDDREGTPAGTAVSGTPATTPTLINTPPPGASLTPTPAEGTPGPGTPTTTPQPGTYSIIEVDPINPDAAMFGVETLGAWQKQNWPLTLTGSQAITIGIVAEPTMNMAIAVYDEADNLIVTQDNAPAGQMEEIRNLRVDPTITYIIQVYETTGRPGTYFMTIVGDRAEVVLYSRGLLSGGQSRQDTLAADHRHFWYFYGQAGDVIDITTTTDPDKLILISFYDMNADLLVDDDGLELEYMEEKILDFTLPETGLYLIWLEEFAYERALYSITVTLK